MSSIYTGTEYLAQNPTWHAEDSQEKARNIVSILNKNDLRPESVCEVGCGAGQILLEMSKHLDADTQFYGFDIAPQALELCRQIDHPRISFQLADLLADETAYFDVVLAIDVFEHVDDYLGFLRQLRPRGKFKVFHIPLDMNAKHVFQNKPILRLRETVGHLHYFSKDTALESLRYSGYEIVDFCYTTEAHASARNLKGRIAQAVRSTMHAANPDLAARVMGGYSLMVLAR